MLRPLAMLGDPPIFHDDSGDLDVDASEDEEDEKDEPRLPIGTAGAVCPRRISLSSLWPCASVISPAETDDPSVCDPAASSSSCSQSGNLFRVRLEGDSQSPTPSSVSPPSNITLDMVFPTKREQILTWHPRRVFWAIVYLLFQRLSQTYPVRRRCRGKQSVSMETIRNWMATGEDAVSGRFLASDRGSGRDMYRRMVSILTGSPIRAVIKDTGRLWEELGIEGKNSWAQLAELIKRPKVQDCAADLLPSAERKRHRVIKARKQHAEDVHKSTCRGYGVSLCFNTSLGQDDVQVIRILQSGLSGKELRAALTEVACYSKFLDACWAYFEVLGKENGFPLVACGLEHSENGSHPARVHVHVYMGMEVRGVFFANNHAMGRMPLEKLNWNGMKPGFARPTLVARRTHAQIHKAVIQSYYYVAGPKKTQMLLRCSAQIHTEHRQAAGKTIEFFTDLFNAFCLNSVRFVCVAK